MLIEEKRAFMVRIGSTALLVTILSLFLFSSLSAAAENNLSIPLNSSCACPNEKLIFNCSVVGGGATVWTGSAFSCATNEIILRHNRFTDGTSGVCNDGAIIGQSLGIENNCSTSQLTVGVSSGLNSRTVMCLVNSDAGMTQIGETTLTVITAPISEVPSGIQLTNLESEVLTFTWNAVNSNCPNASIIYQPNSNCSWSCVVTSDTTTAVCSGLQLSSVCTFTVQTEVCGQMGLESDPIILTLRAPDKPAVNIIPVYSAGTQGLLQIKAEIYEQASVNITDTVSDSVTSYSISYNSAKTVTFDRNTSCVESTCAYLIDVPSDLCQSSNDVSVALSASNRLGQGPPSDSTTIDCTNRFVQVEYDRTTTTITCRFLDETDTSVKSCNVSYGRCGQELIQPRQLRNYSTMEAPNIVYIKLPVNSDSLNCYNVTASSDVFTVIVQALGQNTKRATDADIVIAIVVPIVAVIVVLIMTIVMLIILIKLKMLKKRNTSFALVPGDSGATSNDIVQIRMEDLAEESQTVTDFDQLNLQTYPKGFLTVHTVSHDCELREYVENELKLEFKRGCVFYEFIHDFEDISEDKEVIFYSEEHREFWYEVDSGTQRKNPLIGHKIPRPIYKGYDIFVQSTGSGARHLPAGSRILYSKSKDSTQVRPDHEPPLKRIISSRFKMKTMDSDMPVEEYCKINKCNVFLELGTFEKASDVVDVILQNKKAKDQLYTGPTARKMVKDHYKRGGAEGFDREKWRVFVLCELYDKGTVLKSGTNILQYKKGFLTIDKFHVLTAGEDEGCSSLSQFVEQKVEGAEFINGNAFYEFKREEDLQYYKEVLHWDTQTDKLKSNIGLFYDLRGVPAVGVKPPRIKGVRVFIQSTSQGARCVKPGDTILYKRILNKSEAADPHKGPIYENTS